MSLYFPYRSILRLCNFFTVNNQKPGADVIVVLSGGKDTRIPHALKLFKKGYAPEILLTDEKKRNIRFAHLFPTNEMIAQAMIEELEMRGRKLSDHKRGCNFNI
ncbi:MAG: hypothetical protein Ct9H300mP28_19270 [Pseudomonadota bacterium]|nr:MAG: hypothetical protein Ct9H300mP28_19270 [Pseudomonadota bacterium]